jgi:hypothetical protein
MNVDTLKCELARVSALYAQRSLYGYDCDLEELEAQIITLYNQILLVENIATCEIPPKLYRDIEICVNRLEESSVASFCNNC